MSSDPIEQHVVKALIKDRKAERRWKIIRSSVWLVIVLLIAYFFFMPQRPSKDTESSTAKPYVSLIRLHGEINAERGFTSARVIPQLIHAFSDTSARGVVLVINSPGGSPVQASIIHDKIIQLKNKYKKKVIVVGQDALASGAYLVATAADKIYVNKDTLTGSIGVIMSGFGFSDAISKIGVSRRVFTAGTNKDRLDPFKPLTPEDTAKIHNMLNEVHQHFIEDVIKGRGNRLQGDRETIFSGDFWPGSSAVKYGLVDGTANTWEAMHKEFNVTHYKNYSPKRNFLQLILNNAETAIHLILHSQNSAELQEIL